MTTKPLIFSAVASALLLAPPATSAYELFYFNPVSAIAQATYSSGGTTCGSAAVDIGLDYLGKRPDATSLVASAASGTGLAGAELNLPDVWLAMANASGGGASPGGPCTSVGATGIFTGSGTIQDPLGRPSVKLHIKFKAAGSSAPPNAGRSSATVWMLTIASAMDDGDLPVAMLDPNGKIVGMHAPLFTQHVLLHLYGSTGGTGAGDGTAASQICDSIGGCVYLDGWSTELATTLSFDAAPGTLWVQLEAVAQDEGFAIVDPVIEPDPSNPEVVVTINGPVGSGTYTPPPGITAEQLTARGIDPGPFIRLGFLEASAPPPPPPPPTDGGGGSTPPPPPAPKYWCSPGFWLNNATSFGASAWPVSERTYYDYNSTAGQLTGCPVATGNPTLLQVLQNPTLYFKTQLKGAGFNCVGDYLSKKSSLLGTVADNNGVCSIDQFGRRTE